MVYTSQHTLPTTNRKYCFLAGSIDMSEVENWRETVVGKLNGYTNFFDPTHLNHDTLNDTEMREHIRWELDALQLSDLVLLNLLPNYKSPVSLIELGVYVQSGKLVVVCPLRFYQRRYIEELCARYNTLIFSDLSRAIEYIKDKKK